MKKKVLIIGSNGQLGKSLQKLAFQFKDVIDFTFTTRDTLDITNQSDIEQFLSKQKFAYCINCAAYTAVDKAEDEKDQAYLINAEAVKYLAISCKKHDIVLIHISTDFVFDGLNSKPYTENDLPNPLNVYGASKLKGENYVQDIMEKYFIIRTSWVYSEFGNNFVKTMIRLSKENEVINVVSDQIGSPTYATDLAQVVLEVIKNNFETYGIYHYSNSGEISWFEFATTILLETQSKCQVKPIPSSEYPTRAKRPRYSVLNKGHITDKLSLKTKNWKESLSKLLTIVD